MSDVTIYTLAEELNMTPSMVSRAFNPNGKISEDKRRIILETAKKYNFSPNKFASRLSMKTVQIGIVINSRFKINADKMVSGIISAYEKLKDYKIKYDITVMNPLDYDIEDYSAVLEKYRSYDGVILAGMSSSKYTDMINKLYEVNPNVVQVQSVNKDAGYLFSSKHDERNASELAAEFLYNCLKWKNRKNILLFTGDMESAVHQDAKKAFDEACKEFELNILESVDMKDDEEYFKKIIPQVFEKHHGKIDGIYITSGLSTELSSFIEKNKIDASLVVFDVYDEIKAYMKKGVVSATISQNVPKQMETAFEMLVNYIITGEKCPKTVTVDVQLVLKSNLYQFK